MRIFTLLLALMFSGMLLQAQNGTPCPGEPTVTYEGQTYNTIVVGNKCWLKENLNVGTMVPTGQNQSNNGVIEKYCYDDLPANCETYGGLYQWKEAMQYDFAPGAQGICPPGWRMPTDDEWKMLESAADSQFNYGDPEWDNMNFRGFDAGKNLKALSGWMYNGNGLDNLGAAILPGGHRDFCGTYYSKGHSNYLWTSTGQSDKTAWYRILSSNSMQLSRRYAHKNMGASVRCVKDYEPAPPTYNLNLEVAPANAGTVTGAGQYEPGEPVNITAEANTSWEFVNWTDDDGIVSEAANFTYTMPADDITLTANFVEEQTGFTCGDPLVDTRDGHCYATVLIGDQCWMAENLNIGTRVDGTSNQTNNGTIEKYCYDNSETNCDVYGGLYQWNEMMGYTTISGAKGICPEGWHLPSDAEWKILEGLVDSQYTIGDPIWDDQNCRGFDAGLNLKSNTGWLNNANGTDLFGFSALPGGYRSWGFNFHYKGNNGNFWSSDEYSINQAWLRSFNDFSDLSCREYQHGKNYGLSVRCLRDETTPPPTYNLNLEVSPTGAGIVTGAGQYEAGEPVYITAEANPGWGFVNWTDDDGIVSESANFVYSMPTVDVTLTANFVEEQTGFTCGDPLIDSRDGQTYATVQIGDQCWMAENLKYLPAVIGPETRSNTVPYYYVNLYYGTDVNEAKATDSYINYGALYNWPASLNACPEGWHLPTDAEWNILTTFLGGDGVAGGKIKSTRTVPDPHPRWESPNTGATNSSGFTGLPGDYLDGEDGGFGSPGYFGIWWASTEDSTTNAWSRSVTNTNTVLIPSSLLTKGSGMSVRCLRN